MLPHFDAAALFLHTPGLWQPLNKIRTPTLNSPSVLSGRVTLKAGSPMSNFLTVVRLRIAALVCDLSIPHVMDVPICTAATGRPVSNRKASLDIH